MIYFLGFLVLVIVVAVAWFLASPLMRASTVPADHDHHQLIAVRDRMLAQLNELDLEERDHNMDSDTALDERRRMEAELADVLKRLARLKPASTQKDAPASTIQWRWGVVAAVVAVPLLAASTYALTTTVPITKLAQVASTPPPSSGAPDPRQMVARLEQRLQQNPNDFSGWILLGRSYAVMGRIDEAKQAHERAYRLMPADYLPDRPEALWFLGLAAYNAGHYPRAVVLWNTLLAAMPPDSDPAKVLRDAIGDASRKSAGKGK